MKRNFKKRGFNSIFLLLMGLLSIAMGGGARNPLLMSPMLFY